MSANPERIDIKVLDQFPEFVAFRSPKTTSSDADDTEPGYTESTLTETSLTPEETIQQAEAEIFKSLRSQLLVRIIELSPAFFEGLVVDLIIAMGYGGTRASVVQRLGKSGDEGIDGIVNEDPLGLDVVYIQAKRYASDNVISRERIQQFAGALSGKKATKGIFVTTSSFSKFAYEYAGQAQQRIILIDGQELTKLMIQYRVGVRVERTVEVKKIDLDYFGDVED